MHGRILASRYRLEAELGQGGMGSVWRAEHLTLRSSVAVKLMDPEIARSSEGAERFRREAQAAASLRSAHVVQVLDYGVDEGTPFLVMELLSGESLAQHLEREQRLSPARTLAIMTQVGRAIGRAHAAGIVHRDLKPDNIFLVQEDGQEIVKVLDFGIAKTTGEGFGSLKTRTGTTMGTPHYMSPEQAEGKRDVDHRTDLWALAVIACECLTGARPFSGETWGELILNICARPIPVPSTQGLVPPLFDAWFAKATNRDPAQRFGSAQELVQALAQALDGRAAAPAPNPNVAFTAALSGGHAGTHRQPESAVSARSAVATSTRAPLWLALAAVLVLAAGAGAALVFLLRARGESAVVPVPSAQPSAAASGLAAVPPSSVGSAAIEVLPAATPRPHTPANGQAEPAKAAASASATGAPGLAAPMPSVAAGVAPASSGAAASSSVPDLAASPLLHRPEASAPKTERPPSVTLRCYADPFTGALKLANGGLTNGRTFACKQNPFTGAYQKL